MFRFLFVLQALIVAIDLKAMLPLKSNLANVVEKVFILLTGVAMLATRPAQRGVLVLIFAMVVLAYLCALGTDYYGFEWRLFFGGIVSIVAPFILLAAEPNEQDRLLGLRVFAAWPIAMTLIGITYAVAGLAPIYQTDYMGTERFSTTQGSAFLAGACFIGMFASLELAERRHFGYASLFVINLGVLVLTASRTPLALALAVCGIVFLASFKRFPLMKMLTPVYFFLGAGIFLTFFGSDLVRRFESGKMSGRDVLWGIIQRQLDAHPWFGVGLGNQQLLIPKAITEQTTTIAAHNEFLRFAVELGYPGAAVFFALTLGLFLVVWNSAAVKRDPIFLVCMTAFYLFCLTDNVFSRPHYFFIMVAALFASRARTAE